MSTTDFVSDENSLSNTISNNLDAVTDTSIVMHLSGVNNNPEKKANKENLNFTECGLEDNNLTDASNEERPFTCSVCHKTYKRRCHLKMHMLTHGSEKPFECKVCNKQFIHSYYLKRHALIHKNDTEYSCDVCNKTFSLKKYLNRHLRSHVSKDYKCDACDFECTKLENLNKHIKTHDVNLYICDQCSRLFCKEVSKIDHKCYKSDIRSFSCSLCDKSFKKFFDFNLHVDKHNNDDTLHICDICNRGFSYKQTLSRHKATHFVEKSFSCESCDNVFATKRALRIHIMQFHAEKIKQRETQSEMNFSDSKRKKPKKHKLCV